MPPRAKDNRPRARDIMAKAMLSQGVEYIFGVAGYPIIETAQGAAKHGLKYVGMRNEQAASYAAAAVGYLTANPGVCMVVPGPGAVHALAGMGNAASNAWPMFTIGGASELASDGLGSFQESLPPQGGAQIQLLYAPAICKYAAKCVETPRIPFYIEQAVRYATMGRPGPCYVEMSGDSLRERIDEAAVFYPPRCLPPPLQPAIPSEITRALQVLAASKSPLLITGKGAAYANATPELTDFLVKTNIPFLPTPMGKGVLPDDHRNCVSAARNAALVGADVVLLCGGRFNWILHFGKPPRYKPDVKVIQVEILPEEIGHSTRPEVALVGHAKAICGQLVEGLAQTPFAVSNDSEWMKMLMSECQKSQELFKELSSDRSSPMNYYCALNIINTNIPGRDVAIQNEGSDTMDIGRTVLNNYLPRKRMDAATWGTMGVGMGQAIAMALTNPSGCVSVQGDMAFGFSGMEFEVACRFELPLVVVILNNNGIGGNNPDDWQGLSGTEQKFRYPTKSVTPSARYDMMATGFGGKGVFCTSADELEGAFKAAMSEKPFKPTIINTMIDTKAGRGKKARSLFAFANPNAPAAKL